MYLYICVLIHIYIYIHIYIHIRIPRCICTTFVHPFRDRHDDTPASPYFAISVHSQPQYTYTHYASTTHTASNHTVPPTSSLRGFMRSVRFRTIISVIDEYTPLSCEVCKPNPKVNAPLVARGALTFGLGLHASQDNGVYSYITLIIQAGQPSSFSNPSAHHLLVVRAGCSRRLSVHPIHTPRSLGCDRYFSTHGASSRCWYFCDVSTSRHTCAPLLHTPHTSPQPWSCATFQRGGSLPLQQTRSQTTFAR
jgi:hypothetical protein